jgi:hypothetical protein
MSTDPFDDLPDQFKKAIKEMMEKLQSIDPEQLENMMKQMFGEDIVEKMQDLSMSVDTFSFPLDPNMAKNFETMMKNMMESGTTNIQNMNIPAEEEPYFEVIPPIDGEGQIIVELPGITDVRQVKWERKGEELSLTAEAEDVIYRAIIPLRTNMKLKDIFAEIKNSVFILPYKE